jgi:hypothetical protein
MFASNTLSEHILRGAIGIAALGYALAIAETHPWVRSHQGRWRCWRFAAARSAGPSACSKPQGSNGAGGRLSIVESGRSEHLTAPIAAVRVTSMPQKSLTEQRDAAGPLLRRRAGG